MSNSAPGTPPEAAADSCAFPGCDSYAAAPQKTRRFGVPGCTRQLGGSRPSAGSLPGCARLPPVPGQRRASVPRAMQRCGARSRLPLMPLCTEAQLQIGFSTGAFRSLPRAFSFVELLRSPDNRPFSAPAPTEQCLQLHTGTTPVTHLPSSQRGERDEETQINTLNISYLNR